MSTTHTYTTPNEYGYYGKFGGAYIPEMLHRNVEELKSRYIEVIYEESFQKEFQGPPDLSEVLRCPQGNLHCKGLVLL